MEKQLKTITIKGSDYVQVIAKEKERENLIKAINGLKNSLNMTTEDFAEDLKKLEVDDLNQLDNGQLMTYFKILNKRKNA